MSNRCYLTVTPWPRIYPSFGDLEYDADRHTALASAGCVPMLWLPLFAPADLVEHTFTTDDGPVVAVAPLARTEDAVARLRAHRPWLEASFADRGPLGHHVDLLLRHLEGHDGAWISIELAEISALDPDPSAWHARLRDVLARIGRADPAAARALAALATVMLEQRFITLDQAPTATPEERWNFFRLLGEGWRRPAAWE
mgnify:CR=1 FL=1